MRALFFVGGVFLVPVLASVSLYGCSSSNPSGPQVTCGPGTFQDAGVCYATAPTPVNGLDSGGGADTSSPPTSDDSGVDATGPVDSGPPPSLAPTFAGVTSVGAASATSLQITWNAATDASTAANEIVYDVYVGTAAGGENFAAPTVTSPPGATSVLVNGLVTGSSYFVVVRAKNQAKHEDTNSVEIAGKPQADTTAPSFGGATTAVPAPNGGIKISWAAGIDDLTPTLGLGYFVYVSATPGGENFNLPTVASDPGATSVVVPALAQPNTKYYVVARAHDAAGNIDNNTVEVSSIAGPDTTAPVFAGCTSAVTKTSTQVTVTWDQGTDDTTPQAQIAYDVFAATGSGKEDFTTPTATFTGVAVGVVTGLKPATSYYFVCRARDLSANEDTNTSERTATTPVDTTPPTFAGVASVTNVTATQAQLNWTAATDPQTLSTDIIYDVYQATSAGGEVFTTPTISSSPGATSIILTVPSSSTLYWVVRARDEAGNEDTNTVEVTAKTGVSFDADVQPIFSQHCAVVGCHVPGNPPEDQNLAAGFAFANIVGVQSKEDTSYFRVDPGSPAMSWLYLKITAQQTVGTSMPPSTTGDTTSQIERQTISDWITQGALNN